MAGSFLGAQPSALRGLATSSGTPLLPLQGAAFGGSFDIIRLLNESCLLAQFLALAASPNSKPGAAITRSITSSTWCISLVRGARPRLRPWGPASGGQIFFATPSTGHGGSGYHMNDLITITSWAGSGALLQVASLGFGSEAETCPVLDAGTGYTNGATHLTTSVSSPGGTGLVKLTSARVGSPREPLPTSRFSQREVDTLCRGMALRPQRAALALG